MTIVRRLLLLFVLGSAACSSTEAPRVRSGASGELPELGELGSCASEGGPKAIDPDARLVVLVHGCNASQGRFRALAELFELHDYQTLCFRYDDRQRVGSVARQLHGALAALAGQRDRTDLTVLGHSQGGLVARAALSRDEEPMQTRRGPLEVALVTVSAPFNGIAAAAHCGARWLHAVSLGTTLAICRAIAGPKWRDIHPQAELVVRPSPLSTRVDSHLEIRTDERNTCRTRAVDGHCRRGDYVFSVREQQNSKIDADHRVSPQVVAAGHAEIVGDDDAPPRKLLSVLQSHGVLDATPESKRSALEALLQRLF
ncbi:MAG: hydrolase [Myxococcaceae bacterium]|nr:hydrolase [Myxococcaceae bacterium]